MILLMKYNCLKSMIKKENGFMGFGPCERVCVCVCVCVCVVVCAYRYIVIIDIEVGRLMDG